MITAIIYMLVSPFVMIYYGVKILFRRLPKGIKALQEAFSNLSAGAIVILIVSLTLFFGIVIIYVLESQLVRDTPIYTIGERVEIVLNGAEGQVLYVHCLKDLQLHPCQYFVRLSNLGVRDFTGNELRKKEYKPTGVTE